MCSLKETGFRGKHKCGVTLLLGGNSIFFWLFCIFDDSLCYVYSWEHFCFDIFPILPQESQARNIMRMKRSMKSTKMIRPSSLGRPIAISFVKISPIVHIPWRWRLAVVFLKDCQPRAKKEAKWVQNSRKETHCDVRDCKFRCTVNRTFDHANPEYGNMRRQFFGGCTRPYFGPTYTINTKKYKEKHLRAHF